MEVKSSVLYSPVVFWKGLTLTDEVKMINHTVSFDQSSNEMAIRGKYCPV